VRLDGVGDAAVCAPLIAALRAAGHDVGAALTTRNAGLFAPRVLAAEHVLERIPWPRHGSTRESTTRARREIAAMRYDIALIASEEPEAYTLAAPIPKRVGFTTGWNRPLKSLWLRCKTTRRVPRVQRIGGEACHEVEIVYRLGDGLVDDPPPADPAVLRSLLVGERPVPHRVGIALQGGGKWRAGGVGDETLRAIAHRVARHGVTVLAGPGEREQTEAVLGAPVLAFDALPSWVAALDAVAAVVTVDSGAAHVAGMLGVPVVDVFPDAHFTAQVARWRPWAAPYRALRASDAGSLAVVAAETLLQ